LVAGLLLAAGAATAAPANVIDGVLVSERARKTLYTFDKDVEGSGKSVCNDQCAASWPPFLSGDDDKAEGNWTLIKRDDGKLQFAYKGKPVYYWARDSKPSDRLGDNVGGTWHVAKP